MLQARLREGHAELVHSLAAHSKLASHVPGDQWSQELGPLQSLWQARALTGRADDWLHTQHLAMLEPERVKAMYLASSALSVLSKGRSRFYLLFPNCTCLLPTLLSTCCVPHALGGLAHVSICYKLSSPLISLETSHGYQPGLKYSFKE